MSQARSVPLGGQAVLLLEGGEGPPVLYLHGLADVHGAVAEVDSVEDLVFHYLDLLDALELERAYHEGIRASELEVLDAGHSPWLEAPEACAALVTAFLQKP